MLVSGTCDLELPWYNTIGRAYVGDSPLWVREVVYSWGKGVPRPVFDIQQLLWLLPLNEVNTFRNSIFHSLPWNFVLYQQLFRTFYRHEPDHASNDLKRGLASLTHTDMASR